MKRKTLFALAAALPMAAFAQPGVNPTTGQVSVPVAGGTINTTTGTFSQKVAGGYINSKTGAFSPSPDFPPPPDRIPPDYGPSAGPTEPEPEVQEPEIPRTYQAAATGGSGEIYCGEDDPCARVKSGHGGYAPYCGEDDDC